jgi:hypothetical protein
MPATDRLNLTRRAASRLHYLDSTVQVSTYFGLFGVYQALVIGWQ